jgi:hypothetical protein
MKRKLIEELVASQGRHFQFEGGLSIYNFVGEMFKRNHKILFHHTVESTYALQHKVRPRVECGEETLEIDLMVDYYELELR